MKVGQHYWFVEVVDVVTMDLNNRRRNRYGQGGESNPILCYEGI